MLNLVAQSSNKLEFEVELLADTAAAMVAAIMLKSSWKWHISGQGLSPGQVVSYKLATWIDLDKL